MERLQRAEAFARLLESTRASGMRDVHADDASRCAELEWGASALIARLLALSMPAAAHPAPAMFNVVPCQLVGALASLKDRLLISEVFGRIALTTAGHLIARGEERTPLSATELDVLRALVDVPNPERWVSHTDATCAHTLHAATFPRTPGLTALIALGVLRPRSPQTLVVTLDGEVGRWRETVLRAGAVLWETGLGAARSDVQWLRDWIDRVAIFDWSNAPAAMSHAGRTRFLNAATEVILREPELRCNWQREELRLRMEQNEPFQLEPVEMPTIKPSTPLGRYRQYEQRFRHWTSHDGGREEIAELIGAVVLHDDATEASPCARIHALIGGSDERPFLAYWVPFALHARPAAIAWCLTHDDLAAFAAGLILELEIAAESTWIGGQEQIERQVEQRIALWDAAMRVVFSEVTIERIDALAAALAEILQTVAAAARTRRLLAEGYAAAERHGMNSILDHTLDAIQSARFSHQERPRPGLVSFRPRVLPYLARPLFVQLASAPEPEKRDFASFPLATMYLFVRWREMVHEARQVAPADHKIPTDQEVASAVLACYRNELDRELLADDASVKPVIYIDDQPDLASLPWGVIARALYGSPELEILLRPVPFQDRIRQIPTVAGRVTTATQYRPAEVDLTQAWTNKLRLHLRILIVAHGQLHQVAAPAGLVDAIEVVILELLLAHSRKDFAAGTLKVFQRLNVFRTDVAALTVATAEALNRFKPDRRATAHASWIDTLDDVGLLMTAVPAILPAGARTHAEHRLASLTKRDFLRDEYFLQHIEQLAEQAVRARELDLADRILQFGNNATRGHSREPEWDEFEYRTRAAIAFARGDRAAFDALPVPDSRRNLERAQRIASTTRFYEALFTLDADPVAAAKSFAHQNPQHSASVALNLFAARLQAAAKITDEHDSRAAFDRALEEWQRNAARLPQSAHTSAQVNVLVALDGARHDDAFDATWASLPIVARLQLTALQVRIANSQRRGKLVVAKLAVDEAVDYHQAGSGIAPQKLIELQAQLASATPIAPPVAMPSALRSRRSVEDFRVSFLDMMTLPAPTLIGVICPSTRRALSDAELLGEYLLWHHIEAARAIVDRKETIRTLQDENKYNDLFVSLLQSRLVFLGWQVADQSRGGKSGGKNAIVSSAGVGERDWVMRDGNGQIAITEAYRLDSIRAKVIEEHLNKLSGYNPIGTNPTFVVVYVETGDFEAFIERYRDFVGCKAPPNWTLVVVEPYECAIQPRPGASIVVLRAKYATLRGPHTVFHLLLHLDRP